MAALPPAFTEIGLNPEWSETQLPPIKADMGVDEFTATGGLVEFPFPVPRPKGLGGTLIGGATAIYDFTTGYYVGRSGTRVTAPMWRMKDTLTNPGPPSSWTITPSQEEMLREIAARLTGCGIDLKHAFTVMAIETRYCETPMLTSNPRGYRGPFQYIKNSYNAAFKKPKTNTWTQAQLLDVRLQCAAFSIDVVRFTEMLKRKLGVNATIHGWMLYLMHQQGPDTGMLLAAKSVTDPDVNLRAYAARIHRTVYGNILGQATGILLDWDPAELTVGEYCELFAEYYNDKANGARTGYQPVTDYIELVDVLQFPLVPTTVPVSSIVANSSVGPAFFGNGNDTPLSGLSSITTGEGIDLTMTGVFNRQPIVQFLGPLAEAMATPGNMILMDVYWQADNAAYRTAANGFGFGAALFLDILAADESGYRYQISQLGDVPGPGVANPAFPLAPSILFGDNPPLRWVGQDANGYVLNDVMSLPYGERRLVWRTTATDIKLATSSAVEQSAAGNATIPAYVEWNGSSGTQVRAQGNMKIRRIMVFPDNREADAFTLYADLTTKIGMDLASFS